MAASTLACSSTFNKFKTSTNTSTYTLSTSTCTRTDTLELYSSTRVQVQVPSCLYYISDDRILIIRLLVFPNYKFPNWLELKPAAKQFAKLC